MVMRMMMMIHMIISLLLGARQEGNHKDLQFWGERTPLAIILVCQRCV